MRKSLFAFLLISLITFLAINSQTTTVEATKANTERHAVNSIATCPNDSVSYPFSGRVFREDWSVFSLPGTDWVSTQASVVQTFPSVRLGNWLTNNTNWGSSAAGRVEQTSSTTKVNLLYETTHDVADGTIETCFQLLSAPPTLSYFPHGVAFRIQEDGNTLEGYGVGFINPTTLALGVLNNGTASILSSQGGFDSTDPTQIRIELEGSSIKVYIAQNEAALPSSPTLQWIDSTFASGKIGYANYATPVEYATLTVDYDCSEAVNQLGTISGAVYQQTGEQYFCDNDLVDMLVIPARHSATSEAEFIDVYTTYADLIANAESEILLTAYLFDREKKDGAVDDELRPLSLTLLGEKRASCLVGALVDCNGLASLYNKFSDPADGISFENDVSIRILVGDAQFLKAKGGQEEILNLLRDFRIPIYDTEPNTGSSWQIEVARIYPNIRFAAPYSYGWHSHAKFLVVDGQDAIVSGFNFSTYDFVGEHDMALHVQGPIVFEARERFDHMWNSPDAIGLCEPQLDTLPEPSHPLHCHEYFVPSITHAPNVWSIYSQPQGENVFSLYREVDDYTADLAHVAALEAATDEIMIMQDRFSPTARFGNFNRTDLDPNLPFAHALKNAIATNHASDNSTFQVRLLVDIDEVTQNDDRSPISASQRLTKKGIEQFVKLLSSAEEEYFEVRFFDTHNHAKAFLADNYVVVGSQNWDMTAWDSPIPDLVEYSLGSDSASLVADYTALFESEWASADCLQIASGVDWKIDIFSISCPYTFLSAGTYIAQSIPITQSVAMIGDGQGSIILPSQGASSGQLSTALAATTSISSTFRILTSNVTISEMTFRDSAGYAIEIGDGVTPIENIVINNVFFENNALGAIKINGLVKNWIIQNNTIVGGQAGVVIDSTTVGTYTHGVRNNIFAGQSGFPIVIESADDGRTYYGYNLFYNCNSAADGSSCDPWLTGTLHISSTIEGNLVGLEPLFEDEQNHDFDLTQRSPAVDSGDPDATHELDFDGDGDSNQRVDIGAVEFPILPIDYDLALVTPQPTASLDLTDTFKTTLEWAWVSTSTLTTPVRLQLATDSAFSTLVVDQDMAISGTYTTTLPDGDYYWRGGFGSLQVWTPIRKFSVTNSQSLQMVSGVSVEAGSAVTLTWPSSGADQYEVWFSSTNPYVTPSGDCAAASNCAIVTEPMFVDSSNEQNRFYAVVGANTSGFFRSPVNQIVGVYRFMLQSGSD